MPKRRVLWCVLNRVLMSAIRCLFKSKQLTQSQKLVSDSKRVVNLFQIPQSQTVLDQVFRSRCCPTKSIRGTLIPLPGETVNLFSNCVISRLDTFLATFTPTQYFLATFTPTQLTVETLFKVPYSTFVHFHNDCHAHPSHLTVSYAAY